MLDFSPTTPFPLLQEGSHTYPEAQLHSEAVDHWLGLNTEAVEKKIESRRYSEAYLERQLWIGLSTRALLTPYTELRFLLHRLGPRPGETLVDLGAGYGRMGFVVAEHHPGVHFVGYEYVTERVEEGDRALKAFLAMRGSGTRIELLRADLSSPQFAPIKAEFYFLYDYGSRQAIEKTLQDLSAIARELPMTVVGRGRASRDLIERKHPWLSQVHPPEHHAHFSIYRTFALDQ